MKFFKDFEQNSGGQPQYPTIQMAIEFFKSYMYFNQNSGIHMKFDVRRM